ncbi:MULTISPECIES: esterase-like activity of phytase family protein [Methylococcus]|uniref:Esterase-like activity of phytase family protein n=1 Tax=Methylococcus capsulatus TaxID=414 RepID=A0ABZ2F5Q6_METCP|nr:MULTISPECIES: esterase-like activity of phytase family protein [Methylococcus]MDF9390976.1 esterase-like activity of phytase family protein [Methylococcus capsulatus]
MPKTLLSQSLAPALFAATVCHAGTDLIAIGTVDPASSDRAPRTHAPLENGVSGNLLGGLGSGLAWAGGPLFIAAPDRGPNATPYNPLVDDTTSYINRFHTLHFRLKRNSSGSGLPFILKPELLSTTLLASTTPLVYGTGALGTDTSHTLGSGAPTLNGRRSFYFSGRSDNFEPAAPSTNPDNGRLDPEGIRISNDGRSVFVSDEYGPYVYQFDRISGKRIKSFTLPDHFAVTTLSPRGADEIAGNTAGRIANKGMEGLAITPDGKTLVGIMQTNLAQDKKNSVRIITLSIASGMTHEYAYRLTEGSGVSEILAINNHEFLVDERDGKGLGDDSAAKVKKLFKIDLAGAADVSGISGDLSAYAVPKTLFLDFKAALVDAGISAYDIPSKIEGIAFGPDVMIDGRKRHTLFVANDNDFLPSITDSYHPNGVANPNNFYVFAFDDVDLGTDAGGKPTVFQKQKILEASFR